MHGNNHPNYSLYIAAYAQVAKQKSPKGIITTSLIAIDTRLTILDTHEIQNRVQIRMVHEDKDKNSSCRPGL